MNPFDVLETILDGGPEAWQPSNAGDTIRGRVLACSVADFGKGPHPVTVLDVGGQPVRFHWMGTILKEEFASRGVQPGDWVAARYEGKKQGSGGKEYTGWKVAHVPFRAFTDGVPTVPPAVGRTPDEGFSSPSDGAEVEHGAPSPPPVDFPASTGGQVCGDCGEPLAGQPVKKNRDTGRFVHKDCNTGSSPAAKAKAALGGEFVDDPF